MAGLENFPPVTQSGLNLKYFSKRTNIKHNIGSRGVSNFGVDREFEVMPL